MLEETRPALQRLGPLRGLPELVADCGGKAEDVFAGTRVTPADLAANAAGRLADFLRILENAAQLTGADDIAIRLGLRQTPDALGTLGALMRCAPTLGDALGDFTAFQMQNSSSAAVYLHRLGEDYALGVAIYAADSAASALAYDLSAAIGYSILRDLSDGRVCPQELLLIRSPPSDPAHYGQLRGCTPRFNQPQCCLILQAKDLACRLATSDPERRSALIAGFGQRLALSGPGMAGRVRHALRPLILLGQDSLPAVAQSLGQHPRQLERALHREGMVFADLKDQIRRIMALELLRLTRLPVGDVGASANYASHSSFIHAFKRWTGTTPSQWRRSAGDATHGRAD